jgi:TROVE domain.
LSAGKDKREVFERLIREEKLGGLALLRNLRNMNEAGVSDELINARLELGAERALPFRYLQAATVAPRFEQAIEKGMFRQLEQVPKLKGHTLLVVDTSGSMGAMLSGKSEVTRRDAAVSVAMIAKEMCERATIYATAGNDGSRKHATAKLPSRRGFAMARSFVSDVDKLGYGGIFLTQCMEAIEKESGEVFDRVIVFTDEQDCDIARKPENAKLLGKRNYLVNVGTYKNGIGYGKWLHIDGWSERVLEYIRVFESEGGNE